MKKQTLLKTAVAVLGFAILANPSHIRADDVNDLIGTILDASPTQKKQAAKFKKAKAAPKVPDMGIPKDQIFDVSAKFPNDMLGKYVDGYLTQKSMEAKPSGEVGIHFVSKNGRHYWLYTREPGIIAAFQNAGWGAKFIINKECPLRIVGKDMMPGWYVVRLPWDNSTTNYTAQEQLQGSTEEVEDAVKKIGDIFKQ